MSGSDAYSVQPFTGRVRSGAKPQEVAAQLEALLNGALDSRDLSIFAGVSVRVEPGCLGKLLGRKSEWTRLDQIIAGTLTGKTASNVFSHTWAPAAEAASRDLQAEAIQASVAPETTVNIAATQNLSQPGPRSLTTAQQNPADSNAALAARAAPAPTTFPRNAIVGICAVAVMLFALWKLGGNTDPASEPALPNPVLPAAAVSKPAVDAAPASIEDFGICPFEGCEYGERRQIARDTFSFSEPPTSRVLATPSKVKKWPISKGTWLTTVTGMVESEKGHGTVKAGTHWWISDNSGDIRSIGQAQDVAVYSYIGEGQYKIWLEGKLVTSSEVDILQDSVRRWWIQGKTTQGALVWIMEEDLLQEAALTNQLELAIAEKISLKEKLKKIDQLIESGANVNGEGHESSRADPGLVAVRSNEIDVLRYLVSKGLDLKKACYLQYIADTAISLPTTELLEYLISQGVEIIAWPTLYCIHFWRRL